MENKRDIEIDAVKGTTIILVVLGHCIQYGSGNHYLTEQLFFENSLFKFIYSFHMPLFMLISGYLFYFSVSKHSVMHNVKTRITTLLVPILAWATLPAFIIVIHAIQKSNYSMLYIIKAFAGCFINNLWFLWAVFYCSMLVIVVKRFFKDCEYLYLIGFLLTFFVPDILNSALYKFMYPFFILGYLFNKNHSVFSEFLKCRKNQILTAIFSGLIFAFLLLFYQKNSFIYTSGYYLFNNGFPVKQLGFDLYRMIIGIFGSVFVISSIKCSFVALPKFIENELAFTGKNTIGIYIISGYIISYILPRLTSGFSTINYVLTIVETIIITLGSLYLSLMIKKISPLNRVLLGGRV